MCCQWDSYLSTLSVRSVGSSRRWLSSVSGWHKRKHGALCKQAYLLFVGQEIMLCDLGTISPPAAAEETGSLLAVCSLLSARCLSLPPSALFHIPIPEPGASGWFLSPWQKGVSHGIMLNNVCPDYCVFNLKGIFNITLVFSNPILCHCLKKPTKNDICKDGKKCPSLPLTELNVMEVGSFSLNICFVCLPVLVKD